MVSAAARIYQPADVCSCCHQRFRRGDKAICIVKVPNGEADTMCLSDWAVILASSTAWLNQHEDLGADALQKLLKDTLVELSLKND